MPKNTDSPILDADGKPMWQEIASVARDPFKAFYMGTMQPDDDTLAARGGGKGLRLYDEIERDTYAYSVLQKRKMSVIARPWQVDPASEDALDKKAADIVRAQFEALNFDNLCVNLLDATLKGFAIGEVMWDVDGQEIFAREVIPRDQRRFTFNVQSDLRLLTRESLLTGEDLPRNKFIVHRFGAKDGNPFGLGLGTRLFWPVYFKRQGITFWLTFADKFGSPTSVGKYPPGTLPADQKKLLDALAAISQDTGVIIPDGMVIELLEAQRSGSTDTYEKLVRYMDEQISRCVTGQTDSSRDAGGALKAASDNRKSEGNTLYQADSDLLSHTIKRDLVRPIVEYNVPGARLPTVWRNFEDDEDLTARAERDKTLFDMGYRPKDIGYINETYGGDWEVAPEQNDFNGTKNNAPQSRSGLARDNTMPAANAAAFAEGANKFPDQVALDAAIDSIPDAAQQAQIEKTLAPILELLRDSTDGAEALGKLADLYPKMDVERLESLLARAMFVSEIWGRLSIQSPLPLGGEG